MKKNKFMRLASGLLVGTLLTTCAISGTFAKYTTQDAGQDSARVAKWGVELQVLGSLYGNAYGTVAKGNTAVDYVKAAVNEQGNEADVSVYNASEDKNVVAPGTKSDAGLSFKLNGTPEVDSQIIATIKTENIFLAEGTYGVMIEATNVTEQNYSDLYTQLFVGVSGTYTAATATYSDTAKYYTLEDMVKFAGTNDSITEYYYPVVYNITSSVAGTEQITTEYKDRVANNPNDSYSDTLALIASKMADRLANGATPTIVAGNKDNGNVTTYTLTSNVYDTNTNLAKAVGLSAPTLGWEWSFTDDVEDEATNPPKGGDDADLHDKLDTILGNLQAGGDVKVVKLNGNTYEAPKAETDYNLETSFSLDITVNQVD